MRDQAIERDEAGMTDAVNVYDLVGKRLVKRREGIGRERAIWWGTTLGGLWMTGAVTWWGLRVVGVL